MLCYMFFVKREPLNQLTILDAAVALGHWFFTLDALLCAIILLGPAMNAPNWRSRLFELIATEVSYADLESSFR